MLKFRPYNACDAERIVSWIKDEVSFRKWCADRYPSYPITADDMNAHYKSMENTDSFFPFTAFDESGVVGHLILRYTDEEMTVVRLGFVIVDDTKRGKGLGLELTEIAVRYAFEFLGAEKVTLGVFENNQQAVKCYRSAGFSEVTLPVTESYHIFGEEWKCIEMELARKTR